MPFVRKLAETVFGAEKVSRAEQPNYSVVEGLAYMCGAEVKTHRETKNVLRIIKEKTSNSQSDITEIIMDEYVKIIWEKNFKDNLEEWAHKSEDTSLQRWWEGCSFDVPVQAFEGRIIEFLTNDGKNGSNCLQNQIKHSIKKSFKKLLGEGDIPFEIDTGDMEKCIKEACKEMKTFRPDKPALSDFIGSWDSFWTRFFNWDWNEDKPLTKVSREEIKGKMQSSASTIKNTTLKNVIRSKCEQASVTFLELLYEQIREEVPGCVEKMKPYLVKQKGDRHNGAH